ASRRLHTTSKRDWSSDVCSSDLLVREFAVATQPEGCVVDDLRQRLFIGEEGEAVWALAAAEDAATEMTRVISVGGPIKADIEGLDRKSVVLGKEGGAGRVREARE